MPRGRRPTPYHDLYRIEDRGYTTPCWIWSLYINEQGYGKTARGGFNLAHRWMFCEHGGEIPDGYHVDHLCFVTSCVNPDHLEAVPEGVNQRRAAEHYAGSHTKTVVCRNGHEKDGDNLYVHPGGGRHGCRKCRYESVKRHRDKIKGDAG